MEESKSVNLKFGLSHHEHNPRLPKLNSTNQVNNIGEYISTENWGRLANTSNDDTLADNSSDILCTQSAIKGYVDSQIGTVNSFLELIDTPSSFTTANALYTVNGTPDGIIETTTLISQPAENQFKITRGTTDLLMTADLTASATCDLNQNLSTTSSVAFNGLDVDGATTLDQTTINTTDGEFSVSGTNGATINTTGTLLLNSSAGPIGVGSSNVDQNINIGTLGIRTINIGNSTAEIDLKCDTTITDVGTQLTLAYDGTNKTTLNTDASGDLTVVPSGGLIKINGSAKITDGSLEILDEDPDLSLLPIGLNKGLRLLGNDTSPYKMFDIGFSSDASASHGPDINFIRSGGTLGTPLASGGNYRIGNINWWSYGGTDVYEGCRIQVSAVNATSPTNYGMRYHVSTAANDETALTLRYGVNDDGKFFVGSDTTTDALNITTDGSGNATLTPNGGDLIVNDSNLLITNGKMLISNSAMNASLRPSGADYMLRTCGSDGVPGRGIENYYCSQASVAHCVYNKTIRSRGTETTPLACVSGDWIGANIWYSYDGTTTVLNASEKFVCSGAPSDGVNAGVSYVMQSCANESTSLETRYGLHTNGNFYIGSDYSTDALIFESDGVGVSTITPTGGELTIAGDITITDLNCADIVASGSLTPSGGTLSIAGALSLNTGTSVNEFSIDGTLAGDSDDACPTEKAVRAYINKKNATSNMTLTGPFSSNQTVAFYLKKTDDYIHMYWGQYLYNNFTTISEISSISTIGTDYRPSTITYLPIITQDNTTSYCGLMIINTDGAIYIYKDASQGDFTGNSFGFYSGSASWIKS